LFESHGAISPFSGQICRQYRQKMRQVMKFEFFKNDFYAGWLFVSYCAIDQYNGPFVEIFIFSPNMSPASPKN
jgi:hypothetical protein